MCLVLIGPCLRDFQRQTNSSLTHISALFLGHGAGSMLGAMASIYVVPVGGASVPGGGASTAALCMLLLSVSVAVVPWCTSLALMVTAFTAQAFTAALAAARKSLSVCL